MSGSIGLPGLPPVIGKTSNTFYDALPNRRIMLVGDSRAHRSTSYNHTTPPHATGQKLYATCIPMWGNWLAGGSRALILPTDNYGQSGDQTDAVLARASTWMACDAATAILIVGRNDNNGTTNSIDQTLANMTVMRDMLLNAGKRVIVWTDTPQGDTVNTAGVITYPNKMFRFRENMLAWRDYAPGRLFVIDPWQYMASPLSTLGYARDNLLGDGVHLSAAGAHAVGRALAPVFQQIFPRIDMLPQSNTDLYSAVAGSENLTGCLNSNPMLDGTNGTAGGTATGDVPTGYTITGGAGLTITSSKAAGSDGDTWWQIAWTGTASGLTIATITQSINSNMALGNTYVGMGMWELEAGSSGLGGVGIGVRSVVDGSALVASEGERELGAFPAVAVGPVSSVTPPLSLATAVSFSGSQIRVDISSRTSGVATAGTIRFRCLGARRVI